MRHAYLSEYTTPGHGASKLRESLDTVIRAAIIAAGLSDDISNTDDADYKQHLSAKLNDAIETMKQHAEEAERLTPNITRDIQVAGLHAA